MAKKNLFMKKAKEFFSLAFDLIKLEINLFIQELWEQTVPILPLLIGFFSSLILLFTGAIFLGFMITSLFYLITNSYWISFMITALILITGALATMIITYFKLKNYHFNLEKTLNQIEKKDEILRTD